MAEVSVDSITCKGMGQIQNGHPKDGQGFYTEKESQQAYAGNFTIRAVAGVVFKLNATAQGTKLDGSKGELDLADLQALQAAGVNIIFHFKAVAADGSVADSWESPGDGLAAEGTAGMVLRCNPVGNGRAVENTTLNCTASLGSKTSLLAVTIKFA